MELLNDLSKFTANSDNAGALRQEVLESIVLMLSPIVPHIAHALWHALGHGQAVIDCAWPEVDPDALSQDTLELVVQVNGKLRGKIMVPSDAQKDAIEEIALGNENVLRFIEDKTIRKIIVVPGKLVNVVAN
jgi:leucyl-tRNA synthetase